MQQLILVMLPGGIITGLLVIFHLKLPSGDDAPSPGAGERTAANDNFRYRLTYRTSAAKREKFG
jgi:hypothetical protein